MSALRFLGSTVMVGLVSACSVRSSSPPAAVEAKGSDEARAEASLDGVALAAVSTSRELAAMVEIGARRLAADRLIPAEENVTERFREASSERHEAPPTTFRSGHVSPLALDTQGFKRTATGWEWTVPSKSSVATPAVYDGAVVFAGGFRSKQIFAVDAVTGAQRWGLALDDDGPSAPACEDGLCAFNTESCTLFVVDAKTGEQRWSLWLGDPLASAPAVAGGRVFTSYPVNGRGPPAGNAAPNGMNGQVRAPGPVAPGKPRAPGMTHVLAAFDLQTGAILWQRWIDAEIMAAPVAEGGKLYATTFAGTILRVDQVTGHIELARASRATSPPTLLADGEIVFSRRADDGSAASETIARAGAKRDFDPRLRKSKAAPYLDEEVQAQTDYAKSGKANDAANGFGGGAPAAANAKAAQGNVGVASVYTMQAFQGSRLLPTPGGNVATMGDELVATDPESGAERWSLEMPGDLSVAGGALASSPVLAGGTVFVGTLGGEVLAVDPTRGEVIERWSVGAPIRAQLLVHAGWIYAATTDGRVVGIDTGRSSWTGWAQWGANAQRTGKI